MGNVLEIEVGDGVVGDQSHEVTSSIAILEVVNQKRHLLDAVQWPEDVKLEELDSMKKLVAGFDEVFALPDDPLVCTAVAEHSINTGEISMTYSICAASQYPT